MLPLGVADHVHAQNTVATDRAALEALYHATDGPNWKTGTNWLSGEPLSTWHGVLLTTPSGRVRVLSLPANRLHGAIPAEIANLTELELLNLTNNDLEGVLPTGLMNLTRLDTLWTGQVDLCAPRDPAFEAWLETIDFGGMLCPPQAQSVIDVAVFHTPAARDFAGGGAAEIESLIDSMVAETNLAYAASGVNQRLSLVAVREVAHTEADAPTDQERLVDKSDGVLDGVHAIRDEVAADVVVLLGDYDRGFADVMVQVSPGFEDRALGVASVSDVRWFAHELGHLMGLRHDRHLECHDGHCSHASFEDAYGYVNQEAFEAGAPDSAGWYTIMAYGAQCVSNGLDCEPVLRFSNPDRLWPPGDGDAMGIPGVQHTGTVGGPANAVRTLNRTRATVANFRTPPAVTVSFGAAAYIAAESGAAATVTVNLSPAPERPVSVPLVSVGATGATASDYTAPGSVAFAATETAQTFTVTAVDDDADDDGETVTLAFDTRVLPSGMTVGSPATATVTLTDDDLVTAAPSVRAVALTSDPGPDAIYALGDEIAATVRFDKSVTVTGTPQLGLTVGSGPPRQMRHRGGGGEVLTFAYTVAEDDSDTDGVSIEADSLSGTIRDSANEDAMLTHVAVEDDAGHKVDGVKPVFESASVNGTTLTLTYGEALDGSSTPVALAFTVNVAGSGRGVSRVAVSGSAVTLTLDPPVTPGQTVRITYRAPGANPIQDAVGNDARPLTNRAVENNTLDTTAPRVSRVAIASNPGRDGIYAEGDVMEVTVTFSETVQVDTANGTPALALRVGRPTRPATYDRGSNSDRLVFSYMVADGDIDTDGVSIAAGRIALNGGTIADFADNPAVLAYEAVPPQPGHAVDGVRPALQGAAVSGDTLTLTYNEALDEDSTPAADDFTVDVASAERRVVEVLVSGRAVELTLDSPVTPGQTVTVSYTPGTRPIRDAAGNAADDLTEYKVGTPPPFVPPPPPPPTPQPPSPGGGGGGGGGRARPPSYPGIIRAEGGDGEVTLTWDAPASRGSSRIEHYEYRIDGEGEWISTGSTGRTHTITGLIAGRVYFFHLRAVSAAGAGAHRISPEATPVADLDFTHFANGGFITSTLALVNAGAYPVRPAIYFYDQDGDPIAARRVVELTPDLEVGDDGALRPRTVMHPLEELTIATHGRGGLRAGSVTVRAPGSIGGVLRFDIPGHGVAGVGDSPTLRDALVPVRRQDGGINTGVAVRNRGTATLKVQCRLMRDGAVLEETIIPLAANGQDSRFIDQVFPAADTSDFAGSVRCTAPEPGRFSAVAFELDGVNRIFTTLPVVPVPAVLEGAGTRGRTGAGARGGTRTGRHAAGLHAFRQWREDRLLTRAAERGRRPRPSRHLLPRPGRRPHRRRIDGGYHRGYGDRRRRRPAPRHGHRPAGRTDDLHPRTGGSEGRIGRGDGRRSHRRGPALRHPRPRSGRGRRQSPGPGCPGPGPPPGWRHQHGRRGPQPGRGRPPGAVPADAGRGRARRDDDPACGQRPGLPVHRPGVPHRRYVGLHRVGAVHDARTGTLLGGGLRTGWGPPDLHHPARRPRGRSALTSQFRKCRGGL